MNEFDNALDWLTKEKFHKINKQWNTAFSRFQKETERIIPEAGGKAHLEVKVGRDSVFGRYDKGIHLCFLNLTQNLIED